MWRTDGIVLDSGKMGHGDDADADEEEEASQADDGSTQNVVDWGIELETVKIGQYISDL